MALTLTKQRDIRPSPGQPIERIYQVRFDDSYVAGGWTVGIGTGATQVDFKTITDVWITNRDSYMILGAYVDTANNQIVITAAASHNSSGVGGHQLNPASSVMNNKLAILHVLGS